MCPWSISLFSETNEEILQGPLGGEMLNYLLKASAMLSSQIPLPPSSPPEEGDSYSLSVRAHPNQAIESSPERFDEVMIYIYNANISGPPIDIAHCQKE